MSKRNVSENSKNEDNFADNLADNMSKEQFLEEPENEISEEKEDTASIEEELAQMKDSYIRLAAEYDNYRKRTIKEKADLIKNGGEKVLIGLLPVIDDFERALGTIDKSNDLESVKEGVELIYQKFMSFLKQNGVSPIETKDVEFNDELFEAVAVVPAQGEDQKGMIIDNVQTGYTLHDKVIRHAKVVVAN